MYLDKKKSKLLQKVYRNVLNHAVAGYENMKGDHKTLSQCL